MLDDADELLVAVRQKIAWQLFLTSQQQKKLSLTDVLDFVPRVFTLPDVQMPKHKMWAVLSLARQHRLSLGLWDGDRQPLLEWGPLRKLINDHEAEALEQSMEQSPETTALVGEYKLWVCYLTTLDAFVGGRQDAEWINKIRTRLEGALKKGETACAFLSGGAFLPGSADSAAFDGIEFDWKRREQELKELRVLCITELMQLTQLALIATKDVPDVYVTKCLIVFD